MTRSMSNLVDVPFWFGPRDQSLFGILTAPGDGVVKAGVVIAPPIGREAHASRFALRALASSLGALGIVSLRFDYHGTGDSDGNMNDSALDRRWVDDTAIAVAELRSRGVGCVSMVGERLGATIGAVCAARCEIELTSLVLWDPSVSGRNFLRETNALEALRRTDVATNGDETVKTSEFVLDADRAADLRRLSIVETGDGPLATRVLVLTRDDRVVPEKMRTRLKGPEVEWATADEQRAMLDVDPLFAVSPQRTIGRIASWLDAGSTGEFTVVDLEVRTTAEVRESAGSPLVAERLLTLGPDRLFGVLSEPHGERVGPTVVMINVSNEDHTGPSRLWVDLARRWAGVGLACVRFDLRGLGASPATGGSTQKIYEPEWLANLVDVVHDVSPRDPSNVVLVGLCSGAYLAVEGAVSLGATGACLVNPPVGVDSIRYIIHLTTSAHRPVRALGDGLKWLLLHSRGTLAIVWTFLRLLVPRRYRVDVQAEAADGGTELLVLTCEADVSAYHGIPVLSWIERRRSLRPKGYTVHVVPELDHSMHTEAGRLRAVALIDRRIRERYVEVANRDVTRREARGERS